MPLQFSKKVIGVFALAILTVGVVAGLVLSKQQSDTRQQASIPNGIVEVDFAPQFPLVAGSTNTINISANTQNLQILGFQLKFQVLGQFSSAPTIDLLQNTGFGYESVGQNVAVPVITPVTGGYEISLAVISSAGIGQAVSTNQPTNVLQLHVSPVGAQNVSITFDNQFSKALDITPQNADQLNTLQNLSFPVTATGITPTNTPIVQATTSLAPTNTPGVGTCNSIAAVNSTTGAVLQNPPKVGDVISFQCGNGNIPGAFRYEFQWKFPGQSTYIAIPTISSGANRSIPKTITISGDFSTQCRFCTGVDGSTCQQWE